MAANTGAWVYRGARRSVRAARHVGAAPRGRRRRFALCSDASSGATASASGTPWHTPFLALSDWNFDDVPTQAVVRAVHFALELSTSGGGAARDAGFHVFFRRGRDRLTPDA